MGYKEKRVHGTQDFPVELYITNHDHPRYEMVCHWHIEYEILRVVKGTLHLSLNERKYIIGEGDIIFISAGILHSALPQGDECVYECIVFNMYYLLSQNDVCNTFIKSVLDYSVLVREHLPAGTDPIHRTVHELFEEMKSVPHGYQLGVKGLLYRILSIIYRDKLYCDNEKSKTQSEKKIARLKDVLDLIEDSYDTVITLDRMAERAKMTSKYFCSYFKEITNKTPMEYLINYRIEQACMQLDKSALSVTEISYNCGFRDLSYFIRTFKKTKNCTPNEFRKKRGV